jgi:hypothetical protein
LHNNTRNYFDVDNPNTAMIFVKSKNAYHGFEKRPMKGVRTSLITN